MSNTITYPSEGITGLIIEEIARDGVVRGAPGAAEIQVAYEPFERDTAPAFGPEGTAVRLTGAAAYRLQLPQALGLSIGQARGDLRIANVAGEISLDAVHGDLRLDALAGVITVTEAYADVRAEGVADLRLTGECRGDLRFETGGALAIASLSGDLRLSAARDVRLGRIHGGLWAEKLTGGIQIDRADGDARLSEIDGAVVLGALAGDLRAAGLVGGLAAAQVSGDVALSGPFTTSVSYTVSTDGDIHLSLPADADLRLTVRAGGRIRSDLTLTPTADGSPTFSATLGQGRGQISLVARGDVRISQAGAAKASASWEPRGRAGGDSFADLSSLGERIRQQVTASLASAGINLETGEMNLSRGDRLRGKRGFQAPQAPTPPARPKPPVPSTDEQIAILKMVAEGKITPEEASVLLNALDA